MCGCCGGLRGDVCMVMYVCGEICSDVCVICSDVWVNVCVVICLW